MNFKIFAELVELKAKSASIFPFALGMLYSWYHYQQLSLSNMLLFFISMVIFNMAVDILDNYMDFHRATDVHDYKEETNIIGREKLSVPLIRNLIISFILVSSLLGLYLAYRTSWIVLWLGIFSFAVGIFYSAGPKPLSTLPVGEIASGFTMGTIIPIICIYLNVRSQVNFNFSFLWPILLFTLPSACAIANLMLANNTCDLEEDRLNNRHTLVHYIGEKNALHLFKTLVIIAFLTTTLNVALKIVPWTLLFIWLIFPKIWKNTQRYSIKPNKLETFPLAIQNLGLFISVQMILFFVGLFL
ncbi:prenyltransferase [Vagococcus silagei]|uniref:Prenyltransferase n=1 Tax=Vagococcus silagei TaxID=2508885 RepID=A0A4S3B3X9_9ENTE|nr:prenyltransferase [Vagococcus silagei]THB61781.1 prenyltransferase [Vagococcus silagei]